MTPILAILALATALQPAAPVIPAAPDDWKSAEAAYLSDHVQLTSRDQFIKAGEAYFSPDGNRIIFQATPVPKQGEADPFYAMYTATLTRDGAGLPTGLADVKKISPPESANTCGWFHPTDPDTVIFGSTMERPKDEAKSGFQVGSRRYVWMFPTEMDVCVMRVTQGGGVWETERVFERPNYDAECSFDSSGRFLLYAHVEDGPEGSKTDADIYVYDTVTKKDVKLVGAKGYDGGPFFSPDGKWICYRSDRKGNDLLQLFVAKIKFDAVDGALVPVGIEAEYQLTDNTAVNWAPYWHPSGNFLVYASSEVSHGNYEVFGIEVDQLALRSAKETQQVVKAERVRLTHAAGADVLPAFAPDGRWMMWTSQRGGKRANEAKPSSQLWIAKWNGGAIIGSGQPTPAMREVRE